MKYGYDPTHARNCPCWHCNRTDQHPSGCPCADCNRKPPEPAAVGYKSL